MDFIKRIGTDRHKFKVQFYLISLSCTPKKIRGDIYVQIKRGEHKVNSSENKVSLDDDGTCDFKKQILPFNSLTLFYDATLKVYQEKLGEIRVILVKNDQKKLLGSFEIDIAEYANSHKENLSIEKQFGTKVKSVLKFDVFIKYLGEGSQTSKSLSKRFEQKMESDFPRLANLLKGKTKSPQNKSQQTHSIDSNSNSHKQTVKSANIKRESQKVFLSKFSEQREDKNLKLQEKQSKNSDKVQKKESGSQKKVEKQRKILLNSGQNLQTTPKKVESVKQKDKWVQPSQENQRDNTKQQHIFFDQFSSQNQGGYNDDNSKESVSKASKQKRTEYAGVSKVVNDKKQEKKKEGNWNCNDDKNEITNADRDNLKTYKQKINELQKQKKQLQDDNLRLKTENSSLKDNIKSLTLSKNSNSTGSEGSKQMKQDDKRKLENQKGELLVTIQNLQEKYNKDFAKYQSVVEKYESDIKQNEDESKGEIKRLKDQYSDLKNKFEKSQKNLSDKTKEVEEIKKRQNDLKEIVTVTQSNLSELKLKIGDKLNDANQLGNKSVIDILTQLSY